ncbi:MAG: radical SAM protein [Planctomycetes bacterium]|nr:radical SAM protein [Planctomycetota bacterium]
MTESTQAPTPSPNVSGSTTRSSAGSSQAPPAEGSPAVEQKHDFAAKLQQPALWPYVVDYVRWQRASRAAAAAGQPEPELPALAPLSINLDLTTACNYACDHCIDWEILNSKVRHEDERLRASIRAMALRGLRSVILIGGGEPTLYPGFAEFVRFVKELGLQTAVVSNGSRNDRILQAAPYLQRGDWVRLSLDAGSNEVFRQMHKPSSQSLTLDEICGWIPRIKAVNPAFEIGFSFVITWHGGSRGDVRVIENIHEIEAAAERAWRAGFDYISFKPFLERQPDGAEVMDPHKVAAELQQIVERIRAAVARARARAPAGFAVLESTNLRQLLAGTWQAFTRQPRQCHMQMLRQVVTPLGTFNCPAHRGVAKARVGEAALWQQPGFAMAATQRILGAFDASTECAQVTCLYHGTNWWLEGLIASSTPLPADAPAAERADWFL